MQNRRFTQILRASPSVKFANLIFLAFGYRFGGCANRTSVIRSGFTPNWKNDANFLVYFLVYYSANRNIITMREGGLPINYRKFASFFQFGVKPLRISMLR